MKSDEEVARIREDATELERDARRSAETNDAVAIVDAIVGLRYEVEILSDAVRSLQGDRG